MDYLDVTYKTEFLNNKIQLILCIFFRIKPNQSPINVMYGNHFPENKPLNCYWLKNMPKQYRLCRKDPAISGIVLNARNTSIQHCEDQFRYDRWNCTRKNSIFKRVYRETALMQALAASALAFSVARACSEGSLKNCHCAKEPNKSNKVQNWRWGGCSDNFYYGKKITKKFLQLRQKSDYLQDVYRHNSEVGIATVNEHLQKVCRCQGVSGSCTINICWKRIAPFSKIAVSLKKKYHEAHKLNIENNSSKKLNRKNYKHQLLYLSRSPTFCSGTGGRKCLDKNNCATLCCARGYTTTIATYSKHCNCRWVNGCCTNMTCDNCNYTKDEYYCRH